MMDEAFELSGVARKTKEGHTLTQFQKLGIDPEWFKTIESIRRRMYRNKKSLEIAAQNVGESSEDPDMLKEAMKELTKYEERIVVDAYYIQKLSLRYGRLLR